MKRSGLILSVGGHCGLAAAILIAMAVPKQFASGHDEAITVELVTPAEVPNNPPAVPPPRQPETKPPPPEQASQTAASPSSASPPAGPSPMPDAPPQARPSPEFSMLDPQGMALFNLRLPELGVDAPADKTAQLTVHEIAAFKAQLKRCWRMPAGLAATSSTRVVIRAFFAPDGKLRAEPALVEASASRDGPAVFQAAMQALAQCQPYTALPRARYDEWKVLDVSFSPREMAGG